VPCVLYSGCEDLFFPPVAMRKKWVCYGNSPVFSGDANLSRIFGGDSSGVWAGGGILGKDKRVLVHNAMIEKMGDTLS